MNTTASTRTLLTLAEEGKPVPKEMALSIAEFVGELMGSHEELRKKTVEQQEELVKLAKSNGEMGLKVFDAVLGFRKELDQMKKVIRLCVAAGTTDLQRRLGSSVVDDVMENPDKFNVDKPSTVLGDAEKEDSDNGREHPPEPTEIPPEGMVRL